MNLEGRTFPRLLLVSSPLRLVSRPPRFEKPNNILSSQNPNFSIAEPPETFFPTKQNLNCRTLENTEPEHVRVRFTPSFDRQKKINEKVRQMHVLQGRRTRE